LLCILLSSIVLCTAQTDIFTFSFAPFPSNMQLIHWTRNSSGFLALQSTYSLIQYCPSYPTDSSIYDATFDRKNNKLPFFVMNLDNGDYSGYIFDVTTQSCTSWTPKLPFPETPARGLKYDESAGVVWACIASPANYTFHFVVCSSISLSTGDIEELVIPLPDDQFDPSLGMDSLISQPNLTGFYGENDDGFFFDGHFVFYQLLPTPKYIDLGKLNPSFPPYYGLLSANKTLLVFGGACNAGYSLRVFDIQQKILSIYYWDSNLNPTGPSHACTGHSGGLMVSAKMWVGEDVFLATSNVYTPFIQFSLNPIGIQAVSSSIVLSGVRFAVN